MKAGGKVVVLGANGFLGSTVARRLAEAGREVRAMIRPGRAPSPNLRDLAVEVVHGEALDRASLVRAMQGCVSAYHCIVDPRAWLHDTSSLFRTNVEGLRNSMDAALEVGLRRFVLSSSVCTIGLNPSGVASEADAFNWEDRATDYVRSRVQAEDLLMEYCRSRGLPGIACNIAMTWGAGDAQPTAHGTLLRNAVLRWRPAYWKTSLSMVGIVDAADAMILAEERGRVGERYIVANRLMSFQEVFDLGARYAGKRGPWLYVPMPVMQVVCFFAKRLAYVARRETVVTRDSLRLSSIMKDYDNSKAKRELGWRPRPMEESIREAVEWFEKDVRTSSRRS